MQTSGETINSKQTSHLLTVLIIPLIVFLLQQKAYLPLSSASLADQEPLV